MKKLLEIGSYILILGVVLNIIETVYFGCNKVAMSRAEEQWDVICSLIVILGLSVVLVGSFNKKDNEESI